MILKLTQVRRNSLADNDDDGDHDDDDDEDDELFLRYG